MRKTEPRWSTEWKSAMETGTSALASFIVTVQVQVVAAGWSGSPSPGTIGPLTVTMAGFDLTGSQAECVLGRGGSSSDVPAGSYVNGYPALPYLLERRIAVLRQRLPQLFHRVDALEAQIKELGGG